MASMHTVVAFVSLALLSTVSSAKGLAPRHDVGAGHLCAAGPVSEAEVDVVVGLSVNSSSAAAAALQAQMLQFVAHVTPPRAQWTSGASWTTWDEVSCTEGVVPPRCTLTFDARGSVNGTTPSANRSGWLDLTALDESFPVVDAAIVFYGVRVDMTRLPRALGVLNVSNSSNFTTVTKRDWGCPPNHVNLTALPSGMRTLVLRNSGLVGRLDLMYAAMLEVIDVSGNEGLVGALDVTMLRVEERPAKVSVVTQGTRIARIVLDWGPPKEDYITTEPFGTEVPAGAFWSLYVDNTTRFLFLPPPQKVQPLPQRYFCRPVERDPANPSNLMVDLLLTVRNEQAGFREVRLLHDTNVCHRFVPELVLNLDTGYVVNSASWASSFHRCISPQQLNFDYLVRSGGITDALAVVDAASGNTTADFGYCDTVANARCYSDYFSVLVNATVFVDLFVNETVAEMRRFESGQAHYCLYAWPLVYDLKVYCPAKGVHCINPVFNFAAAAQALQDCFPPLPSPPASSSVTAVEHWGIMGLQSGDWYFAAGINDTRIHVRMQAQDLAPVSLADYCFTSGTHTYTVAVGAAGVTAARRHVDGTVDTSPAWPSIMLYSSKTGVDWRTYTVVNASQLLGALQPFLPREDPETLAPIGAFTIAVFVRRTGSSEGDLVLGTADGHNYTFSPFTCAVPLLPTQYCATAGLGRTFVVLGIHPVTGAVNLTQYELPPPGSHEMALLSHCGATNVPLWFQPNSSIVTVDGRVVPSPGNMTGVHAVAAQLHQCMPNATATEIVTFPLTVGTYDPANARVDVVHTITLLDSNVPPVPLRFSSEKCSFPFPVAPPPGPQEAPTWTPSTLVVGLCGIAIGAIVALAANYGVLAVYRKRISAGVSAAQRQSTLAGLTQGLLGAAAPAPRVAPAVYASSSSSSSSVAVVPAPQTKPAVKDADDDAASSSAASDDDAFGGGGGGGEDEDEDSLAVYMAALQDAAVVEAVGAAIRPSDAAAEAVNRLLSSSQYAFCVGLCTDWLNPLRPPVTQWQQETQVPAELVLRLLLPHGIQGSTTGIDRGAEGEVLAVTPDSRISLQAVAVKRYTALDRAHFARLVFRVKKELQFVSQALCTFPDHVNCLVTPLMGMCVTKPAREVLVFMRRYDSRTLHHLIEAGYLDAQPVGFKLALIWDLCHKLLRLHACGFVHMDLKTRHVMFPLSAGDDIDPCTGMFADFGNALFYGTTTGGGGDRRTISTPYGTPRFMAPELRKHQKELVINFDRARRAEAHSFAVIAVEILAGHGQHAPQRLLGEPHAWPLVEVLGRCLDPTFSKRAQLEDVADIMRAMNAGTAFVQCDMDPADVHHFAPQLGPALEEFCCAVERGDRTMAADALSRAEMCEAAMPLLSRHLQPHLTCAVSGAFVRGTRGHSAAGSLVGFGLTCAPDRYTQRPGDVRCTLYASSYCFGGPHAAPAAMDALVRWYAEWAASPKAPEGLFADGFVNLNYIATATADVAVADLFARLSDALRVGRVGLRRLLTREEVRRAPSGCLVIALPWPRGIEEAASRAPVSVGQLASRVMPQSVAAQKSGYILNACGAAPSSSSAAAMSPREADADADGVDGGATKALPKIKGHCLYVDDTGINAGDRAASAGDDNDDGDSAATATEAERRRPRDARVYRLVDSVVHDCDKRLVSTDQFRDRLQFIEVFDPVRYLEEPSDGHLDNPDPRDPHRAEVYQWFVSAR